MKTTMKMMSLGAVLATALSATAPARADEAYTGLYVPYDVLAARVKQDVARDFSRQTEELGLQIQQQARRSANFAATADARTVEVKDREGAFWM